MKTVSFCSLGCRVNQYEIQSLREDFILRGYKEVTFGKTCDIAVINTCAVTKDAETKSRHMISRAVKTAEKVAVIGCYAELLRKTDSMPGNVFYMGGNSQKSAIPKICEGYTCEYKPNISYDSELLIGRTGELPNERYRAYVKIQDGCSRRCAYCVIPFMRGKSFIRSEEDILAEVDRLASNGVSEIIFTGIEVSDYGSSPLCRLIKKTSDDGRIKRIRLGSINPASITDEFIQTAKVTPSFCKHIHLSVQSANTNVLKRMRRPYDGAKLRSVCDALYKEMPDLMLTADIISGFPGETYEEFEDTAKFLTDYRFMHIHAFPYSKRPLTDAATFEGQIPDEEKKKRNAIIIDISNANKKKIAETLFGKQETVLVEKVHLGKAYGHTDSFFEAEFESGTVHPGDFVTVTVQDISENGVLISTHEPAIQKREVIL